MESDKLTQQVHARYRNLVDGGADPNEWAYAWRSEYNRGGFKAVDFLMREVVDQGKCIGCAACVTICPVDVFDYVNEQPKDTRHEACVYCELCADVCPVLRPTDQDLGAQIGLKEPLMDDGFGPYHYGCYARATDKFIAEYGQDGGVCTALMVQMLEDGEINGVVMGIEEEDDAQSGYAKLCTTREEIIAGARSRYTYQPNTVALVEAMKQGIAPIAVIGVPCQVNGVRQQQYSSIRLDVAQWYEENIKLVIGLFCSEAFTAESVKALSDEVGVPVKDITNINIKGKVIVKTRDGEEKQASLKWFGTYARPACLYCLDYAADHSDIGLGGIGIDGWTFTVVRTEAGHKYFQALLDAGLVETQPLENFQKGKDLLIKLSTYKRKRPLPALMPTLAEREEIGNLDPKHFYKEWQPPGSAQPGADHIPQPPQSAEQGQEARS